MDNDRIKKKAEELAERLKSSGSQLKNQGEELADRIKNRAREVGEDKGPRSDDSLEQAKNKIREKLGGAKKTSRDVSSRLTDERSEDQRGRDDLDDRDGEEEVA
jgi:hypothetical protein